MGLLVASKLSQDNLTIIQGLLKQNYSIDHIAELMAFERVDATQEGAHYWRGRIMMLIEKGLLIA